MRHTARAAGDARGLDAVRARARCWWRAAPTCAAAARRRTPAELAEHDCLHYLRDAATRRPGASSARRPHGERGRRCRSTGRFAANNSEALREAALAGLGIALLPDFSAQAGTAVGKLVEVLPQWRPVGVFGERLYAIRPYSAQVPRAVEAFVAYLRDAFAAGFAA